jgi:putative ABC transport system ATP-binding protein
MRVLRLAGLGPEVYRLGLLGRIDVRREPETAARLLEARAEIAKRLSSTGGMKQLVVPFDPEAFNTQATIAENLLFGLATSERFSDGKLAVDDYARSILEAEALLLPLARIGLRMAETVMEVFADLPPGHPLFERFSFIRQDELQDFQRIVEQAHIVRSLQHLPMSATARLIGLALSYVEPRHRLRLVDAGVQNRIIRARRSFKAFLPQAFAADVEFYDPARYSAAASIRDNLLFGRITHGIANAEMRVQEILNKTLQELDLERVLYRLGLDFDVGPGGKQLFAPQKASIALARGLIARPQTLVIDGALSAFGAGDAQLILAGLRTGMAERSLIVTLGSAADAEDFDMTLAFEGARYVPDGSIRADDSPRDTSRAAPAQTPAVA